jgi:hypothetical protein
MSKRELIVSIQQVNRTAKTDFLERFGERDLQAYLDRVCSVAHDIPPPDTHVVEPHRELVAV